MADLARGVLRRGAALVEAGDLRLCQIGAADAHLLGKADVFHLVHAVAHGLADKAVTEHGVLAAEDAVHRDRVAALLKIEVAADVIDQHDPSRQERVEIGNGPVQPERVEAPLLGVREQALRVFQRAGDAGLAVSLQNGHIDQIVERQRLLADADVHIIGTAAAGAVLLQIDKGNMIPFADVAQAAGHIRRRGPCADPGALEHDEVLKALLLKIFDDARHKLRMRGRPACGRCVHDQIGLDADALRSVADVLLQIRRAHQVDGHLLILGPVKKDDLVFIHVFSRPSKASFSIDFRGTQSKSQPPSAARKGLSKRAVLC